MGATDQDFALTGSILNDPCGNGNVIRKEDTDPAIDPRVPTGDYGCWQGIGNGIGPTIATVS